MEALVLAVALCYAGCFQGQGISRRARTFHTSSILSHPGAPHCQSLAVMALVHGRAIDCLTALQVVELTALLPAAASSASDVASLAALRRAAGVG